MGRRNMYHVVLVLMSSAHPASAMVFVSRQCNDCFLQKPPCIFACFIANNLGSQSTKLLKTRQRRILPSEFRLHAAENCNGEPRNGHSNSNSKPYEIEHDPQLRIPPHVGIVLDGNGRWATQRNLPVSLGHAKGADRVLQLLPQLRSAGVQCCTLYCFSTENWSRPPQEVNDIMSILERTLRSVADQAIKQRMHIKLLGSTEDLPSSLLTALEQLDAATNFDRPTHIASSQQHPHYKLIPDTSILDSSPIISQQRNGKNRQNGDRCKNTPHDDANPSHDQFTLCLAINYGGRRDLVDATQRIARAVQNGEIDPLDINETLLSSYLSTSGLPDPDLIIRTGGEQRLSNFLLWNAAYSELYFTDVLWPDFDEKCLMDALKWYACRNRRFGGRNQEKGQISRCRAS